MIASCVAMIFNHTRNQGISVMLPQIVSIAKSLLVVVIFAHACAFDAKQAHADLLDGQQVTWKEAYPTVKSVNDTWGPLTVGPGPELTVQGVRGLIDFMADISDKQVIITFPHANQAATGTFNGYILIDSATAPPFETTSLDPGTTLPGMSNSRITFDPHDIFFNLSSLPVGAGNTVIVDINSVPEPSSLTLVILGGAGCVLVALLKKRAALNKRFSVALLPSACR